MERTDRETLSAEARDHAENPRNYGPLKQFDGHARISGPRGETMEFWLYAPDGIIETLSYATNGSDAARAAGSMATTMLEGKRIEDAGALTRQDLLKALGDVPADADDDITLVVAAVRTACNNYQTKEAEAAESAENPNRESTPGAGGDASPGERKQGESDRDFEERQKLQSRLGRIRHKLVVLSGKGGVGKSTVAANVAIALSLSGKKVGLLDVDIHGPSIPTMLGLEGQIIRGSDDGLIPVEMGNLNVMSIGFLLQNQDDAVIWRGPMKMNVIRQFLSDVIWGDLDFLIVDSPPGTGDEPLSVCQLMGEVDGAIIVTTPQRVAAVDVRKSITFCRHIGVPVLGVVENMSGFVCPKCGETTSILGSGGGRRIAEDMGVQFLGSIPIEPQISEAADRGNVFIQQFADSQTAEIMRSIVAPIAALEGDGGLVESLGEKASEVDPAAETNDEIVKISIPLAEGKLAMHFGHCERFTIIEVDTKTKKILNREDIESPPHEPGLLPRWLADRGATVIIAGGMGQMAKNLFEERGIHVMVGAPSETPEHLVNDYLAGNLRLGDNSCDH
ncbi:MAG TPA: chromosome partitioning protein ParA [Deltaproteobacteria bacterium]|nr:chromosome partitioning protein ParA [Deltaproteobacteria bacterium]